MTIRIPRRIRDAIEARAEREERSAADVVNKILAESFPAVSAKDAKARRG